MLGGSKGSGARSQYKFHLDVKLPPTTTVQVPISSPATVVTTPTTTVSTTESTTATAVVSSTTPTAVVTTDEDVTVQDVTNEIVTVSSAPPTPDTEDVVADSKIEDVYIDNENITLGFESFPMIQEEVRQILLPVGCFCCQLLCEYEMCYIFVVAG